MYVGTKGRLVDPVKGEYCNLSINPVPDVKDIMEHYSFFYRLQENYPVMENING